MQCTQGRSATILHSSLKLGKRVLGLALFGTCVAQVLPFTVTLDVLIHDHGRVREITNAELTVLFASCAAILGALFGALELWCEWRPPPCNR